MRKSVLRLLIGCGLALLTVGFVWGALYAGVPYQDATPAQEATFAFHANVAGWFMSIGLAMLVAAFAAFVAKRFSRRGSNQSGQS